ncbi:hypothetical protein [Variovorax paradoxus]|nr:hypothetical protein [Variovorax paradoxus]
MNEPTSPLKKRGEAQMHACRHAGADPRVGQRGSITNAAYFSTQCFSTTRVVLVLLLLMSFLWNSASAGSFWPVGHSAAELHSVMHWQKKTHRHQAEGHAPGNQCREDDCSLSQSLLFDDGVHFVALLSDALAQLKSVPLPGPARTSAHLLPPDPLLEGLMRPPRLI